jgi:hypothetical protein
MPILGRRGGHTGPASVSTCSCEIPGTQPPSHRVRPPAPAPQIGVPCPNSSPNRITCPGTDSLARSKQHLNQRIHAERRAWAQRRN